MCRMLAYAGTSHKELATLHEALKEASRVNETGQEERGGVRNGCADGWGYVIVNGNEIEYYRSRKPIGEDKHRLPVTDGKTFAILHSRRASDPSKVGKTFAHPFSAADEQELTFLAHNGRISMNDAAHPGIIDTEYALRVIMTMGVEAAIPFLESITEDGLNLLIMQVNKITNEPLLQFLNFYVDPSASHYFDMFYTRTEQGLAVVSSTLVECGIEADAKVPFGKLMDIEHL